VKPFYVIKARNQYGNTSHVVMDYLSKLAICRVRMVDKESEKRWADKIAQAMNKTFPTKD
jgi:hypothetical protein